jgi:hypothetical protein
MDRQNAGRVFNSARSGSGQSEGRQTHAVLADAETVGSEVFLGEMAKEPGLLSEVGYRCGDILREEIEKEQKAAEASDPTLKAAREMQVSETEHEKWLERSGNIDRLGHTPASRERLRTEAALAEKVRRMEADRVKQNADARETLRRLEERSAQLEKNAQQDAALQAQVAALQKKLDDATSPPDYSALYRQSPVLDEAVQKTAGDSVPAQAPFQTNHNQGN